MKGRIHLVGIGGAGLSAIARVLHERGETVTGSDQAHSIYTQALELIGVPVVYGHRAENVAGADVVLASSAIPDSNVELQAARDAGIPVLRRAAFLGELTAEKQTIAVAGTHGKSTTSGMIAWLLDQADRLPSFIVGGVLIDYNTNARSGDGPFFVIEADEYARTFLGLRPAVAVVTNVEHDHPDIYPTEAEFQEAFRAFAGQVKDLLVVCGDDPVASSLHPEGVARVTYGLGGEAEWRAEEIRPNAAGGSDFLVLRHDEVLGLARTRLPGEHNVLNALAALAVVDYLGVDFKEAREGLTAFRGVGRRFEILGEMAGVTVVDDYAHHPTEIRATLRAARQRFPDQTLWAVFQPHTFSRARILLHEFVTAFEDADHVIVTEVFASREKPDPEMSGSVIAEQIEHRDVRFCATLSQAADDLLERVHADSVVVTLSAGDGNEVGKMLLQYLSKPEGGKSHA
jgi:UDP-N-acetylmuramate--alanine ligase